MQCNFQPLQEYVFGKYSQKDDEKILGQINQESKDQIPNNEIGEEIHVSSNLRMKF